MHELGYILLLVALVVATFAGVASVVGTIRGWARLQQAGYAAAFATAGIVTAAALALIYLFVAQDFGVKYVHHYSDRSMPMFYLITSIWGGQDGSLLFWAWVLSMYSAAALWLNREHARLIPYATGVLMTIVAFFIVLLLFSANPFETFLGAPPDDGKGLNPLLQNPYMAIHPPTLYLGYIGMSIPFAFGIAALASGQLDETWLRVTRRWTLFAWFFLSIGLVLGMLWAYEELGWGGYWAWDPVENAGFLPWLTCTAFLHSVMIQERRGMFRFWNMSLVIITFVFTILGTFLTRSGVVQSVHSFAQSDIGGYFLAFMLLALFGGFGLMFWRSKKLAAEAQIESLLSKEFAFAANNWILLGMAFFILIATLFPSFSDWLLGEKITVGQSFFNRWMVPLGLSLLFLTGVGPLISWRRASKDSLKKQFLWPVATGIAAAAISMPLGAIHAPLAVVTYGLCGFVAGTIVQEYLRGIRIRMKNAGEGALDATIGLVSKAKRRYGGYVIHFGVVLMFFGWAGNAYKLEKDVTLTRGEIASLGRYQIRYDDLRFGETKHKGEVTAVLTVMDPAGKVLSVERPAKWMYRKSEQPTTEVSIRSTLLEDLYLILAGWDPQQGSVMLRMVINPFTLWVWLGAGFLLVGIVIVMWPDRYKKRHIGSGRVSLVSLALGAALAGAALPATPAEAAPSSQITLPPELEPVADRLSRELVCMCGTCDRQTLHDCTCGFAQKEREEIRLRLKAGATPEQIVQAYVQRFGTQALNEPPDTPFNRLIVIVPFAALGVGAVGLGWAGLRWKRRADAAIARGEVPLDMAAPKLDLDEREEAEYREQLLDALEDLD
ncbi:MAG: heme lyase CcmF/NrfE family subunit [Deltaproteobacteria bacterium]|nr:MAG: heme lyase CcmF/NrfE family subunit [Deltaproteobacteria bacterium]